MKNNIFDIRVTIPINTYFVHLFKHKPELFIPDEVHENRINLPVMLDEVDVADYTKEFLVVGGRHHMQMHKHLDQAYDQFLSQGPIDVLLTLEPDNPVDKNAINVKVNYGEGFKPVGYIVRDSTRHLQPLLHNNIPITAKVKRIHFGLLNTLVGYKLHINVNKQGQWND